MTVWLFPGQGAQYVGMGKALFEQSPAAREVFERADAALGDALSRRCFEGPESELVATANTQPAILTVSIAALAAIRERLPQLPAPRFVAGHSLGEYSALVAADVIDFEDAVRLVRLRGAAMQRAVPEGAGGMAAVMGSDADAVLALCHDAAEGEVLAPANLNGPGQIVIAGTTAAIARAIDLAGSRRMKLVPLKVSAPFHSALMAPAAEEMRRAFEATRFREARIPVVTNVEAAPNSRADRVAALLTQQVTSPVLWDKSVRFIASQGVRRGIEIGPGKVLAGLVRRIEKSLEVLNVQSPDDIARLEEAGS